MRKARPDVFLMPISRKRYYNRYLYAFGGVATLVFLAFILGGYFYQPTQEIGTKDETIAHLRKDKTRLSLEIQTLKQNQQVNQESMRLLEQRMALSLENRQKLEEELAFHKALTDPSKQQGIQVNSIFLGSTLAEDTYEFNLILAQTGLWHPLIKGGIEINIVGWEQGKVTAYPLYKLSKEVRRKRLPVGFRYFQSIPGPGEALATFVLPDGFSPERIDVQVDSRTPNVKSFSKSFPWEEILQDFQE